jgi:hypothetical protein
MERQRVSVAMCTYNGERFLREQMESIASQTHLPDELVVCDDGSTDGTCALLEEYARGVPFSVKIRRNAIRLGPAKNFEQAISLCGGEIIVLSDQDDIWRRDRLQALERVLRDNPDAGYAFSDAAIIDGRGTIIHPSLWAHLSFDAHRRAMFCRGAAQQAELLVTRSVVTGATLALRASLKPLVLPMPEGWVHDEWITLSSSLQGVPGVLTDAPLVYYRLHRGQARGVQPLGLLQTASWFLKGYRQPYQPELRKSGMAYALAKGGPAPNPGVLHFLEGKLAHSTRRVELYARPRLARVPAIAVELARGRYHRFSAGCWSAMNDLLIPTAADPRGR